MTRLLTLLLLTIAVQSHAQPRVGTDLQRIVDDAVVLDQYGYATQSTVIAFAKGDYYLDEPLVYRGQPHTQLTLRGVGIGTVIHYRGDGPYAIRFEGANKCSIESMRIINEASRSIKQVVWWDAVNADPNPPKYSGGSSGCRMSDVWIGSEKNSLAKDGCLIAIAHKAVVTSQVSSMVFDRVLLDGPDHGTGVHFRIGGNVKCFAFNTIGLTHLDYGIDWDNASSTMVINDLSASDVHQAVVRQIGAGNLVGKAWNCECNGSLLWQAGGNSSMFATITGFEWTGDNPKLAVRSHGATRLEAGRFQAWGKVPWIEMTYPIRTATQPCSLHLDRVWFADGDEGRLPIRDGSGNKLLHPESYYKDKPVSLTAENCFVGQKKVSY